MRQNAIGHDNGETIKKLADLDEISARIPNMTDAQLSDRTASEIQLLSEVARVNRTYASLRDIVLLTSIVFTETELRDRWDNIPQLRSYKLDNDLLLDPWAPEKSASRLAVEAEKRVRAEEYVRSAKAFFAWNKDSSSRLVAISGSTSYLSPRPNDDLDFFIVSEKGKLWIQLFKSLLLARTFRLFHRSSPRICFSYVADEAFAEKEFATEDPLLARDALNVLLLQGEEYYQRLVQRNKWISDYFPKLYKLRTESRQIDTERPRIIKSSLGGRSLNLLLFFCVGHYIRIKSYLLNRRFLRSGQTRSLFTVKSGLDHCIFESVHYSRLRQMYNQVLLEARRDERTNRQG